MLKCFSIKNTHEINRELLVNNSNQNNNNLNYEINFFNEEILSLMLEDKEKALIKANIALKTLKEKDPNNEFIDLYFPIYNLLGLLNNSKGDLNNAEKFFKSIQNSR